MMPAQQNPYAGGIVPMTVEPIHDWEKQGLTTMANPPAYGEGSMVQANRFLQQMLADPKGTAANYTNPMATDYMTQAGKFTAQGAAPITMQNAQDVANPYASAMKNRLTEEGERARAAILAGAGTRGARSFGDIVQGQREGQLDRELVSKSSDIDFNTFESAFSQLQKMRDRELSAGGQFGSLAQGAQGITNSALSNATGAASALFGAGSQMTDVGRQRTQDQIGAGKYVRDYNQGVNDMIGQDILASIQDNPQKMSQVLSWLQSFQSGMSGGTDGANSMETIGGLLGAGSSLADYFGGGGSSSARNAGRVAGGMF